MFLLDIDLVLTSIQSFTFFDPVSANLLVKMAIELRVIERLICTKLSIRGYELYVQTELTRFTTVFGPARNARKSIE